MKNNIKNNGSEELYLDGKKVDNLDDVFGTTNQQEKPAVKPDNTTAPMSIPQTGILSITIIAIIAILMIGGYSYYRYKNIDK